MNTITADELKEHLYIFASDAFEGRETGTRGQKLAANYLSDAYHHLGLKGPIKSQANPYLQRIPFLEEKTSYGTIRSKSVQLDNGTDFLTQAYPKPSTATEMVFVGHGMETEEYNDYENIDVKGKAICAIWGDPMDSNGKNIANAPQDSFLNLKNLAAKGITDLFITFTNQQRYDAQMTFASRRSEKFKPMFTLDDSDKLERPYNLYFISPSKAAQLFGTSSENFFNDISMKLNQKETLGGLYTASDIEIEIERPSKTITSENIVAVLPGRDLKDEVVIISSHYDHVGINDGKIYNGADDDGSGSMGVLEIAEAFIAAANEGNGPRRTVVFLNVTGEEKGLWGSEYYADVDPIFPLSNTVANLNIDMIGRNGSERKDDNDYIYIIGSDMLSTELHGVHEKVSSTHFGDMDMDYLYNGKTHPDRFYYRSDHYNFAKHNIPVIFYFNGTHEDYHKHTDTPDKIDYPQYAKRTQLIFATAWQVANMDNRPVVDVLD
tara:strand:- start:2243 stop:3721 length:1479 start_codon:yes stop_codon:yes gene_type:complete